MIGSTSSDNNVHGIVDDNSNSYRNMVMDAVRINQDHADQCPIIDEEHNAYTTKIFNILKISKIIMASCTNQSKLSVVT